MMLALGHASLDADEGPDLVQITDGCVESYLYRERHGSRGAGQSARLWNRVRSDQRISGSYLSQRKGRTVGSQLRPSVTRNERLNEMCKAKRSGQSIGNTSLRPSFWMISFDPQPLADGIRYK